MGELCGQEPRPSRDSANRVSTGDFPTIWEFNLKIEPGVRSCHEHCATVLASPEVTLHLKDRLSLQECGLVN